jgi:hypothetical protein
MKRIFLTLAVVSTGLLLLALALGLAIGDARSVAPAVRRMMSYHLLASVAALIFACLVHATLLTYFMGTGRWIEETSSVYKLDPRWKTGSSRLKYRTLPLMALCLVVLILNVPLGAVTVDATGWTLPGLGTLSLSRAHLVFSVLTIVVNAAVNVIEYRAIGRNGELIVEVVDEVHRIREALGLPTG